MGGKFTDYAMANSASINGMEPAHTVSENAWANIRAMYDRLPDALTIQERTKDDPENLEDLRKFASIYTALLEDNKKLEGELVALVQRLQEVSLFYWMSHHASVQLSLGTFDKSAVKADFEEAMSVKLRSVRNFMNRYLEYVRYHVVARAPEDVYHNVGEDSLNRTEPGASWDEMFAKQDQERAASGIETIMAILREGIQGSVTGRFRHPASEQANEEARAGMQQTPKEEACDCEPCVLRAKWIAGEIDSRAFVSGVILSYEDEGVEKQVEQIQTFLRISEADPELFAASGRKVIHPLDVQAGCREAGFEVSLLDRTIEKIYPQGETPAAE